MFYPECKLTKNVCGQIMFHQCNPDTQTRIYISLEGLEPFSIHAIHIHEFGPKYTCDDAGGHFNPEGEFHGSKVIHGEHRHVGDLAISNIHADGKGRVNVIFDDDLVDLFCTSHCIIGRSVMIHEKPDDLGLGEDEESLKSGNAGGRMLCAAIVLTKPEHF